MSEDVEMAKTIPFCQNNISVCFLEKAVKM